MSFLTPLFLIGLAGLAIPVVLHLIQRERKNVVEFPSLMFLRKIPYESVQRRRVRNWPLLLLRLAVLALLVAAFGRPFLRRADLAAAAASGARELVVVIDRSYSMAYGDRWQRAQAAARDAVRNMRGSDRASLVFFASDAEVAVRSTADRARLEAAIAAARPGSGATKFAPALKLAGSLLSESQLPRREALLITDFQRNGWRGGEGVRLPDGAVLTPFVVGDGDTPNLSVTAVTLQRSTFAAQERIAVSAGVINRGARAGAVDVTLEVDGRAVQTERVQVGTNASSSATFAPFTLSGQVARGTVRISPDALDRDNSFHFVVTRGEPLRVLLAERAGAGNDANLYLTRALAVGDAPKFDVSVKAAEAITTDDLQRASVLILNDVPATPQLAERLIRFAERGGGVLAILGERATWPAANPDTFPAVPGAPVDRTRGDAGRIGALEYGHPIFEVFRAPRTGDFPSARFYGYRSVALAKGAKVLARFDDGAPALVERQAGSGRVLVWTSTIDQRWNDLAVKPVFLPFVHRLARYLGAYRLPAPWHTVGDVVEPPVSRPSQAAPGRGRVVLTPAGERVTLDSEGPDVLELAQQGFYEVRTAGREAEPPLLFASNVDLTESDLTGMDPRELVVAAAGRTSGATASGIGAAATDEAQEKMQRLWWYLLFAALILFGGETVLANRTTR